MAWRPSQYVQEGELENTTPNKVTGWIKFAGMKEKVTFDLEGDFHRDIRGAKIHLTGDAYEDQADIDSGNYFDGIALHQTGKAGDITAGLPPYDYSTTPYIEIYSNQNGRIVVELEPVQVEVIGIPIPAIESDPIDRKKQAENMANFLSGIASACGIPEQHAISTGNTVAVEQAKKVLANDKIRGMKLLPQEILEMLPPLYSQDGNGGKAIAYCKLFTPDSGFSWWITEGGPITDTDGKVIDYHLFGLVEGQCRELGYVSLNELEELRGPMGLPVERDLWWKPKTLEEIAPEMFQEESK